MCEVVLLIDVWFLSTSAGIYLPGVEVRMESFERREPTLAAPLRPFVEEEYRAMLRLHTGMPDDILFPKGVLSSSLFVGDSSGKLVPKTLSHAETSPVRFEAMDTAVDWIERHRTKILADTVIVIAGAAFIAAVGASGGAALVFVPVVLVASSGNPSGFELMPETP